MKTKSLILALAVTGISFTASAQKGVLNTAKSEFLKYESLKAQPKLAEPALKLAKESIDKAVLHDKTMNDPSAWAYKALIYSETAYDKNNASDAQVAADALKKAVDLDKEGANKSELDKARQYLYYYQVKKGKAAFDKQDFATAYTEFNKGLEFNAGDTTANYAAGLAAMYAKDYPNAIARFNELKKTNYSELPTVYSNLSVMYAGQKDTAAAIKVLAEGSARFPQNADLATREIEFNLMSGRQKEVISKITAQMEKSPENKLYPFYLGIAYSAAGDNKNAETAYKKAIAVDPNYADAYINLGGLIMNNGIDLYNQANKLPASKTAEFNAMRKKSTVEFDRALPFLEKATELNPKSELALRNLKQYYLIKNNSTKAAEIDAKIKALQ